MITSDFNVRKASQVVAFFARAEGGRINVLKVSKLVYLADREFAARYDEPMLDDYLVSMDHGPVDSGALDMINGMGEPNPDWDSFVAPRQGYDVPMARLLTDDDFDELSSAERGVLSDIWQEFGHMTQYEIRDHTHRACPEWENPRGSSNPIPYERLFKYLGKSDPEGLAESIEETRQLNRVFKRNAFASRGSLRSV